MIMFLDMWIDIMLVSDNEVEGGIFKTLWAGKGCTCLCLNTKYTKGVGRSP